MTREIKVRAFHKETKTWHVIVEWDFGNKCISTYGIDEPWYSVPVEEFEISQWTGWRDKNHVLVFEGDIVKLNNSIIGGSEGIAEVVWVDDLCFKTNPGFSLWFINVKENNYRPGFCDMETFLGSEVIGNIYEGHKYE